jgi:iron complex outermembrane receptor protein
LSVYDLTKQNAVTTDLQDLFNSIQTGEIRSKGVELEAITTVMDDLKLTGSLSYSDVKSPRATTATKTSARSRRPPSWPRCGPTTPSRSTRCRA